MINLDDYSNKNKTEHNSKWPYSILMIEASISGKTSLINNQPDIDKTYLYAKDPYEAKYQLLINKTERAGLKHFNDPKASY